MNKNVLSFIFVGLTLGLLGQAQETQCSSYIKKAAIVSSLGAFGLCVYRFYSKKTSAEPVVRFESAKLLEAAKTLDSKEFFNQVWYFIDDIFVGQPYKADGVRADKEGKLEVKKGNPCSGFMGNFTSKMDPITKSIAAIIVAKKVLEKFRQLYCGETTIGIEVKEMF